MTVMKVITAKEMADNAKVVTSVGGYHFLDKQFKRFCEQLCREQRDICLFEYTNQPNDIFVTSINRIENAKMPEL